MHKMIGRSIFFSLAVVILAASNACSDQPVAPRERGWKALRASTSPASGSPELESNTRQYRNTSLPNAIGRSGAAVVTARALLNKNGTADLEVSTGSLDGAALGAGAIFKAQVKAMTTTGTAFTRNYNALQGAGYWKSSYPGLVRGADLQIQANVRGIERNRTDVVTLTEKIKLRPDIAVNTLASPAQVRLGQTAIISATLSEQNGDVGATAECDLYVNGARVEGIPSVWVNRSGSVTCTFMHTFAAVGAYTLAVAAENVTPGDYDATNNISSGSLEVVSPSESLRGTASAYKYHWDYQSGSGYPTEYPAVAAYYEEHGDHENVFAYGVLPEGRFPARAQVTITTGQTTLATFDMSDSDAYFQSANCAYIWRDYNYAYLCPGSSYQVGYYRDDAVYFSGAYTSYWDQTGFVHTKPLLTGQYSYGSLQPWGASVDFDIKLTIDGQEYSAKPSVLLHPFDWSRTLDQPYACSEWFCSGFLSSFYAGVTGMASF